MTDSLPINAIKPRSAFERTLDEEIRSLVWRYGADEVRAATKRETAKKRGRNLEKDWLLLKPYIQQDAADWLEGKDPCELRSNYSIAKAVSEQNPGHSVPSTHRRLMGKLATSRRRIMLYVAMDVAEKTRPFAEFFHVLHALRELGGDAERLATLVLDTRNGQLQRYRDTIGEPDPSKSISALSEELSQSLLSSPFSPPRRGVLGMLG